MPKTNAAARCPHCDQPVYARGVCKPRYYQVKRRIGSQYKCADGVSRVLTEEVAEAEGLWFAVKDIFAEYTEALQKGKKRATRGRRR